ncbi:MAG TPA: carbonic anhydrase, partial [Deltaproteobacteria bacterium]|nr:carbonic anhydrase [Deltaproteobacteria bacterium]
NQVASAQGSVDYGILHLHTPVLLIMGHSDCGAVKAFMKGYEKENDAIKGELDNLKATITEPGTGDFEEALVKNVKQNVLNQVIGAVKRYQTLVDEGRLTVVGAYYDFVNTFGKGFGRVVLLSVNGVTDAAKMRAMPQLAGLDLGASLGI